MKILLSQKIRISACLLLIFALAMTGCTQATPTDITSVVSTITSIDSSSLVSSDPVVSTPESVAITSESSSIEVSSEAVVSKVSSAASSSAAPTAVPTIAEPDPNTYYPLGKNIMPIGAWVSPPPANYGGLGNPDYITLENYQRVAASGLNFIHALYERADLNLNDVLRALDFADEVGIKYMVRDNQASTGIDDPEMMQDALDQYSDKPAYLGNLVFDEPAASYMDDIGSFHANFRAALPDAVFYVNLLPTYATKNQLFIRNTDGGGGPSTDADYVSYLDQYTDKIQPQFISYDYYPCVGTFPNLKDGYFDNMAMIRHFAMEENVPFWVFIQNCSFGSNVRNPGKAEIEWQVNTALAFGAKGIQYFCYWSPIESETFSAAMVTKTGEATNSYTYIQTMNHQIEAVDQVLMNSSSKGVIVSGTSPVPIPDDVKLDGFGKIKSIQGTVPSVTGCFRYEGKNAYYIVNNTVDRSGTITVSFKSSVSGEKTQGAASKSFSGTSLTLTLSAGEGALIVENERTPLN